MSMPDPSWPARSRDGRRPGKQHMEDALEHGASPSMNGWTLTYHVFDYNLDFFEVGHDR